MVWCQSTQTWRIDHRVFDGGKRHFLSVSLRFFRSAGKVRCTTFVFSFYVLKTREQSDRRNLTLFKSFQYHLRSSFTNAASGSAKVPSLYRAFWFSNFISLPSYGLYLSVYISTKDYINSFSNRSAPFYAPFIAGALGTSSIERSNGMSILSFVF